jgi:hypothetical protein
MAPSGVHGSCLNYKPHFLKPHFLLVKTLTARQVPDRVGPLDHRTEGALWFSRKTI